MKNKLIILIASLIIVSCNGQKKDTIMTTEKFDVEAYKQRKEKDPMYGGFITLEDGTIVFQSGPGRRGGAYEIITPPKPAFYKIRKRYFKSTNTLAATGKILGNMKIGVWQFFDEKGKLVREVDEDKKLDGHDYHKALEFLEKEGWIDIKTGEGRDRFSLGYKNDIWYIIIEADMWNGYLETSYEVDANTLKILKKTRRQLGQE